MTRSMTAQAIVRQLVSPGNRPITLVRLRTSSSERSSRLVEEVRRRTKVIGRFPGETSCLTMAWAVMDLVIAGAHGLGLTLPDRHAIAALIAARAVPQTEEQIA